MDDGVQEQTLSATKPDNHNVDQEVNAEGQENMEIEEGLITDQDENLDLTKVLFPCVIIILL